MSFGGPVRRGRRPAAAGHVESASRSDEEKELDWERVAVFGTGIALGAAIGAGVALLFAPLTGDEARAAIVRGSARLAHIGRDAWDELRDELEWAAKRGKRRVGRRVQRARWSAEDFVYARRRPDGWLTRRRPAKNKVRHAADIDERNVQEIVEELG
jgi:hypothetical protein